MILNTNMGKIIRKNVIDEPYLFIYDFLKFRPPFRLFLLSNKTSKLASKIQQRNANNASTQIQGRVSPI